MFTEKAILICISFLFDLSARPLHSNTVPSVNSLNKIFLFLWSFIAFYPSLPFQFTDFMLHSFYVIVGARPKAERHCTVILFNQIHKSIFVAKFQIWKGYIGFKMLLLSKQYTYVEISGLMRKHGLNVIKVLFNWNLKSSFVVKVSSCARHRFSISRLRKATAVAGTWPLRPLPVHHAGAFSSSNQESRRLANHYSVDCSHATTGLFCGLLVMASILISLIVFFTLMKNNIIEPAITIAQYSQLVLYCISTLAVLIAMHQV